MEIKLTGYYGVNLLDFEKEHNLNLIVEQSKDRLKNIDNYWACFSNVCGYKESPDSCLIYGNIGCRGNSPISALENLLSEITGWFAVIKNEPREYLEIPPLKIDRDLINEIVFKIKQPYKEISKPKKCVWTTKKLPPGWDMRICEISCKQYTVNGVDGFVYCPYCGRNK